MSSKRKSQGAAVAGESPSQKRSIPKETREEVTEKGQSFLRFLKAAKDKGQHTISEHFLELPSEDDIPGYYEFTKLPVSLATIEGKLERGEYSTMTTVESDLKRMVFNAKAFNDKNSEIHRDAEKIRKMVTHHMKERKLNPAYQDPSYSSFPTPLPDEEGDAEDAAVVEEEVAQGDSAKDTQEEADTKPKRKFLLRGPANATPGESGPSENEESGKQPTRQRLRLSKPSAEKERLRQKSNPPPSDSEAQGPPIKKIRLRAPTPGKDSTGQEPSAAASDAQEDADEDRPAKKPKLILRSKTEEIEESQQRSSSTPAAPGTADVNEGFEGMSFQRAQEKIVQEMLDLHSEEGDHIAGPFVNLPSREIKDYYQVIKHPVSLKAVMKLVRGIKGREKPTGQTFLTTWQDLEDETSYIWNNARLYNEDGSEISELVGQLEDFFKKRLAEAKAAIPDPPGAQSQRIKLHVKEPEPTPKLKLSAGAKRSADEMNNYSVDTEALKRQRQLVLDGVNGRIIQSAAARSPSLARENSATSLKGDTGANGAIWAKADEGKQLPASATSTRDPGLASLVNDAQPLAAAMMPPPPTTPLPRPVSQPRQPPLPVPRHPWDSWKRSDRPEGLRWPYKTISEVIIASHPSLNLGSKAYRWELQALPDFNYATDVLPMRKESHRLLVAPKFVKATYERPFVSSYLLLNGSQQQPHHTAHTLVEDGRPVYDLTLDMNDMNEIEIQCYTQPTDPCSPQDVVFDRYTAIIHPRAV